MLSYEILSSFIKLDMFNMNMHNIITEESNTKGICMHYYVSQILVTST